MTRPQDVPERRPHRAICAVRGCPRSSNLLREASARSSTFAPAGSRWPTPPSTSAIYVIRCDGVEIHRSARRHGVSDADIIHAVDPSLVVVDVDRAADPPTVPVIGPALPGARHSHYWGTSVYVS